VGEEIIMTDEMLVSVSKFLRRAFVGKLEEDELVNCVSVIENEIMKRRIDAARKHRSIRG
jgi:hypothetical protein